MSTPITATVTEFNAERGLGKVETVSGERLVFHSTSLTDSSRHIDAGAKVTIVRTATHGGGFEAGCVVKLDH